MPKLGMGPIRREQICVAAAAVIAREGFSGTTMRVVAREAGVSTGMLNHHFENRQDLLTNALVYVSERALCSYRAAIAGVPAGRERLLALLDAAFSPDPEIAEAWSVWINACAEAAHVPELRPTVDERQRLWWDLLDDAFEGLGDERDDGIPLGRRLDALLNGLAIQAIGSGSALEQAQGRVQLLSVIEGWVNAPLLA